jgi:hypothetical protein
MANWTNIANTSLEPGSPARSVDAFALRDNPIAIAQGAAGAPRIAGQQGPAVQTAGLFDGAVTTAKIANGNVTAVKLATGTSERDWVLARTAGAGAQAIGSYALGSRSSISSGSTYSASSLTGVTTGTWRAMGAGVSSTIDVGIDSQTTVPFAINSQFAVFLRIS